MPGNGSERVRAQRDGTELAEEARQAAEERARATRELDADGEPIIDDGKPLKERALESELAAEHGAKLAGVVDKDGEKRLENDPADPSLDFERDAGVIVRQPRSKGELNEAFAPVPPPPRRDTA